MNTLFGKLDEISIERLREFEESALQRHPDGYYLAYSGGKDSEVLLDLAKRSGVKFTAHYALTTVDPPEVVYHVRTHPEVEIIKPKQTMWQLIRQRQMPPRRNARYCCEVVKEVGGSGRIVLTGVRWAESTSRSRRKMLESCYKDPAKRYLNPIIDWSTSDVWGYLKSRNIPYCKLYDEGFHRVGCVLCPFVRDVHREIIRWPKIAAAWEKAVKATWNPDKSDTWADEEAYWKWWLDRDAILESDEGCLFI